MVPSGTPGGKLKRPFSGWIATVDTGTGALVPAAINPIQNAAEGPYKLAGAVFSTVCHSTSRTATGSCHSEGATQFSPQALDAASAARWAGANNWRSRPVG